VLGPTPTTAPANLQTGPSSPDLCSKGDAVRLAADVSLPLINTNARMRCDFRNDMASAWLVGGSVVLQVLGWFFATLFVVGVTGVIRRE